MAVAVKMPQLGETVVEGTVSRWLKSPGDTITREEPLLEISTDKIDTEVPAPAGGTLLRVQVAEGETVRAGEILAYIGAEGETLEEPSQTAAPVVPAPEQSTQAQTSQAQTSQTQTSMPDEPPTQKPTGRDFISPVVAKIAREHAIDPAHIEGSGLGGRVTKKDMLAYIEQADARTRSGTRAGTSGQPAIETTPPATASGNGEFAAPTPGPQTDDERWEPLNTMRRFIADHMVASKRTSPHVTSVFEVDMTAVVRHREANKATFAGRGLRLTFTPYFVAAAAASLARVPELNARFHEQNGERGIIHNRRIHIGMAVAVAGGLVVPVIRDADELNLAGLTRAVNQLAQDAQDRRLAPDATHGGTFTITNHGTGGSLLGTPIINQPQSAILGVGAITKRPVVRSASPSLLPSADDAIVIRPMCYLSLTFDHRLIDGATADAFLTHVCRVLEDWQTETA